MRHPIQRRHLEQQFRRLLREGTSLYHWAKDCLAAEEGRLGQAAPVIPRVLLPAAPPLLPDGPPVLIPLPGRACAVALLPDLGIAARGNHGCGSALGQGIVAGVLVLSPVRTDL